ncbi:MAG TPA: hypothetical protein PLO31_07765, partial [Dysgonamonadaceae bacterium]|nr:hypothetical protein [Dysgonamonadaceae bacterium]
MDYEIRDHNLKSKKNNTDESFLTQIVKFRPVVDVFLINDRYLYRIKYRKMLNEYLNAIQKTLERGDAREESYYGHLKDLILAFARENNLRQTDI